MTYIQDPQTYFQYGNGMPAFRGGVMQRGYGLGGMFKGLFRAVAPKLKKGLVNVGKRTLKTGIETLTDIVSGKDLKSSLKNRANQNILEMIQANKPIKRKKQTKPFIPNKKAKRVRRTQNRVNNKEDLFS